MHLVPLEVRQQALDSGSLAVGGSGRSRPQPLIGAAGLVLLQPLHFIMQTRQSRNLRARVSAQARGLS